MKQGNRVRVREDYPRNNPNPGKQDIELRGKLGTIVQGWNERVTQNSFVPVLLDENKANPEAWGCFFAEELEVVSE